MSKLEKDNENISINLNVEQLRLLFSENSNLKIDQDYLSDTKPNYSTNDSLLLVQLHTAQEEIEKLALEKETIKSEFEKIVEVSKQQIENLKNENQLLLNQLHILQEEFENKPKTKNDSYKIELRHGAAERIKKELPYVVGSTIIQNSKSLTGVVKLPFDLANIVKHHNTIELPNLNEDDDAKHIKNHLSYKIGKEVVDSIESPSKIFTLPTRLSKEILKFRIKKSSQ